MIIDTFGFVKKLIKVWPYLFRYITFICRQEIILKYFNELHY